MKYLETVLRYLVSAAPEGNISYEEIRRAVEEALPNEGDEQMRTVADSLIERGMQQGMQQGMLQSTREGIFEVLEARFEVVPQSIVKKIEEIGELSLLKSLHKKSVVVNSLEQFKEIMTKLLE